MAHVIRTLPIAISRAIMPATNSVAPTGEPEVELTFEKTLGMSPRRPSANATRESPALD